MKVLLDKGIIPYAPLKDSVSDFCGNHDLYLVTERNRKNEWQTQTNLKTFYYESLAKSPTKPNLHEEYGALMEYLLSDSRVLMILERVSRDYIFQDSLFNKSIVISNYALNSLDLLRNLDVDALMFQATPHHINSLILGKTAEFLKVPVFMIQTAPQPGRFWLVKGLDVQKPVAFGFQKATKLDIAILDAFVNKIRGTYKDAIPSYEKIRLDSRKGKIWSWRKEFKDCLKDPRKLLTVSKKRKLYEQYVNYSKSTNIDSKSIVLFLHYQPERTSLPEGFHYYQQLTMIHEIAMHLPKGWSLLVKEHPSSFTGVYDPRYRCKNFYDSINHLENVKLIPFEWDSFNLIEKSEAVVTITGSVGIESLLRGKPVIVFGLASYRDFKNVWSIREYSLKTIISKIINTKPPEVKLSAYNDLKDSLNYSLSTITDKNEDIHAARTRIQGHVNLLDIVLKNPNCLFEQNITT